MKLLFLQRALLAPLLTSSFIAAWTTLEDVSVARDLPDQVDETYVQPTRKVSHLSQRAVNCGPICPSDEDVDPDTPLCRALCSPQSCGTGAKQKRQPVSYEGWTNDNTTVLPENYLTGRHLAKRQIRPVTQGELRQYVADQMYNGNEDPTFGSVRDKLVSGNTDDTVFRQYALGNEAFQVGTGPLTGCSAVIVVSKRAVYMGHVWESGTWSCSAAEFNRRALSYFNGGPIEGVGDRFNSRLFDMQPQGDNRQDDTRVFVMHPRRTQSYGNSQSSNYRAKVPQLLNAIRNAIGWQNVPVALYNYIPVNERNPDGTETQAYQDYIAESEVGTALFQYDPNARGTGVPGWRIFLEYHQFQDTDPPPGPASAQGVPDPAGVPQNPNNNNIK